MSKAKFLQLKTRLRHGQTIITNPAVKDRNGDACYQIVPETALPDYLAEGWRVATEGTAQIAGNSKAPEPVEAEKVVKPTPTKNTDDHAVQSNQQKDGAKLGNRYTGGKGKV